MHGGKGIKALIDCCASERAAVSTSIIPCSPWLRWGLSGTPQLLLLSSFRESPLEGLDPNANITTACAGYLWPKWPSAVTSSKFSLYLWLTWEKSLKASPPSELVSVGKFAFYTQRGQIEQIKMLDIVLNPKQNCLPMCALGFWGFPIHCFIFVLLANTKNWCL